MRPITAGRRKGRPETLVSALRDLARQADDQIALAAMLQETLQEDLRAGFAGSDLNPGGTLTVFAAAPEWAARLRFETPRLEQAACDGGWPVKRIRIKLAL